MNGKGDKPRPLSVDNDTYANNFDRIFGKKESQKTKAQKEYDKLKESGMFWELFPHLTGDWEKDKHEWYKQTGE